ncbi:hypothetical protein F5B21DRAFT_493808 [Xylaria acuta]|nr:hypothetical protein F5B21DRAFT_493808 [Xylaria acuta]
MAELLVAGMAWQEASRALAEERDRDRDRDRVEEMKSWAREKMRGWGFRAVFNDDDDDEGEDEGDDGFFGFLSRPSSSSSETSSAPPLRPLPEDVRDIASATYAIKSVLLGRRPLGSSDDKTKTKTKTEWHHFLTTNTTTSSTPSTSQSKRRPRSPTRSIGSATTWRRWRASGGRRRWEGIGIRISRGCGLPDRDRTRDWKWRVP